MFRLSVILFFALHASSALAQPNPTMMFDRLDADKDGKITKEELSKMPRGNPDKMMENIDSNEDGAITLEEFETAFNQRPQ